MNDEAVVCLECLCQAFDVLNSYPELLSFSTFTGEETEAQRA